MLLLLAHDAEFLLLEHLHPCDLQCLTAEHRQNGFDILVETEQLIVLHQGLGIDSALHWNLVSGLGTLQVEVGLVSDFVFGSLVC